MSQVLHKFHLFDLKTLNWDAKFEDIGMDSLDSTALLTSFEHEFHTVFEDRVFESFDTLKQV